MLISILSEVNLIDFNKIWWDICRSIMLIIDWIGKAFNFIIGADTVIVDENGQEQTVVGVLESLFTSDTANINYVYWGIALGCIVLMGAFIAIGALKAQFTDDVPKSIKKMTGKSFASVLKIIALPFFFWIALMAVGVVFRFLIDIMSTGNTNTTLAQGLCDACNNTDGIIYFDAKYEEIKDIIKDGNFAYLLCILSGSFLIVTLTTCCIALTKRFIEIFFYYLVAPIAIARTPIDDGKSFDLWKDNTVAKLFGAGGIIIAMYLYYKIMPAFIDSVNSSEFLAGEENRNIRQIIIIMFLIGGSCVPASATMMFAQLISQGAGQNEANNMMHTQQMMGNAARLANTVGGKALMGAVLSGGSGAVSGATGALFGSAGGAGVASAGGLAGGSMAAIGPANSAFTAGSLALGGEKLFNKKNNAGSQSTLVPKYNPITGAITGIESTGSFKDKAINTDAMNVNSLSAPSDAVTGLNASIPGGTGFAPGAGVPSITRKGFAHSMADAYKNAWDRGKADKETKAKLGIGGAFGRQVKRATGLVMAPVAGMSRWAGGLIRAGTGNSRLGVKTRQKTESLKSTWNASSFRRQAAAEKRAIEAKDKKWNAAIASGGDKATARIEKELNDLETRISKWDKQNENLMRFNPDAFSIARQQQFGGQYATVVRRLNALDKNRFANKDRAIERLNQIGDGSYGSYNTEKKGVGLNEKADTKSN